MYYYIGVFAELKRMKNKNNVPPNNFLFIMKVVPQDKKENNAALSIIFYFFHLFIEIEKLVLKSNFSNGKKTNCA